MVGALLGVVGFGMGFSGSPRQAAALESVPGDRVGMAAGTYYTGRYLGGVLGASLAGAVLGHDGDRGRGDARVRAAGAGRCGYSSSSSFGLPGRIGASRTDSAGDARDGRLTRPRHAGGVGASQVTTPGDQGRLIDRPASPCPAQPPCRLRDDTRVARPTTEEPEPRVQARRIRPDTRPTDVRRLAAAGLSAVLPGLGQLFNGRPALAALFLIPSLVVLLVGVMLVHDPVAGPAGRLGRLAAGPRRAHDAQRPRARVAAGGRRSGLPRHPPDGPDRAARDRRHRGHRARRGDPAPGHLPLRDGPRRHVRPDLHERRPGHDGPIASTGDPLTPEPRRADQRAARRGRQARRAGGEPDRHDDGRLASIRSGTPSRSCPCRGTSIDTPLGNGDVYRPEAQLA